MGQATPMIAGVIIGASIVVTVLGLVYIVRDIVGRPTAPAEHHRCNVCHDRGAFLIHGATKPSVCPWCRRGPDEAA